MSTAPTGRYDGVIERTADGGVIRFERRLAYPIEEVWHAITDPERLGDWWLPFDADITVDLRVGGEIVMAGRGDGAPTMQCTILRVEAPNLLEYTHGDPGSFMRWELEEIAEGCLLRVAHFVTDVASAVDRCFLVGLQTSLDRFEPALASRPVDWDWDAFAEAQAHYSTLGFAPPVDDAPTKEEQA